MSLTLIQTQPLTIQDETFTTTSHTTYILRDGTQDCNAMDCVVECNGTSES
jgi:hypothetical protein